MACSSITPNSIEHTTDVDQDSSDVNNDNKPPPETFHEHVATAKWKVIWIAEKRANVGNVSQEVWEGPVCPAKMFRQRSDLKRRQWKDPAFRARMTSAKKKLWKDPDYRANRSRFQKEQWQKPVFRAKTITSLKKRSSDPAARVRKSAITKAMWTLAMRAKMSIEAKQWWKLLAFRAKIAAAWPLEARAAVTIAKDQKKNGYQCYAILTNGTQCPRRYSDLCYLKAHFKAENQNDNGNPSKQCELAIAIELIWEGRRKIEDRKTRNRKTTDAEQRIYRHRTEEQETKTRETKDLEQKSKIIRTEELKTRKQSQNSAVLRKREEIPLPRQSFTAFQAGIPQLALEHTEGNYQA